MLLIQKILKKTCAVCWEAFPDDEISRCDYPNCNNLICYGCAFYIRKIKSNKEYRICPECFKILENKNRIVYRKNIAFLKYKL